MKLQGNYLRTATALVIAATIASQIPQRASVVYADTYNPDDTGDFLGIPGLKVRDVIQAGGFGLVAYGVVQGTKNSGGTAGSTPAGIRQISSKPIYDITASRTDDFSEIKRLVDQAGLQATLRGDGPYTFFAPTNTGMSQLSPQDRLAFTQPGNQTKLSQWLKFHVVVGRYTIAQLKRLPEGTGLPTLAGDTVVITHTGGLKIHGVDVVENDIPASNGWIHPLKAPLPSPEALQDAPTAP